MKRRRGWCLVLALMLACTMVAGTTATTLSVPPAEAQRISFSAGETLDIKCLVPAQALSDDPAESLFAATWYQQAWFARTADGRWLPWDGEVASLPAFAAASLARQGAVDLWFGALGAGEYLVYCASGRNGERLRWISDPSAFVVFADESAGLHAFQHRLTLQAYLKKGLQAGGMAGLAPPPDAMSDTAAPTVAQISGTNLQETGVDEADSVKVHADILYTLADCDSAADTVDCLRIFTLQGSPAQALRQAQIALPHSLPSSGLYLRDDAGSAEPAQLISLASGDNYVGPQLGADSLLPYNAPPRRTEVAIYDLRDALAPAPGAFIAIEGALVASRRIGGWLYLVTRFAEVADFYPLPMPIATAEQALPTPTLPYISIDDQRSELVRAEACFLPPASTQQPPQASLTTLLAIPLDAPSDFRSACIAGPIEAVYASTRNIYLATTRSEYGVDAEGLPSYTTRHHTDVHKFAFADAGFAYRGSASVEGHLGWEPDKRAFRFGEHDQVLRVATSVGESWNETSSTRVALLRESPATGGLRQISQLTHLGKPGERLYAARFFGERGYLVTFRLTDPLYVLDLADAEHPHVAGELEISGYSDYLHPVGSDYLLGIGKEAVPDVAASDLGSRGAWYQGLKLTLFDVSNAAAPSEVDTRILGKRGTHSPLLADHHALSYVPANGTAPARIALPVEWHDRVPESPAFVASDPSSFYDWTQTGLHVFDLQTGSAPAIIERARLVVEQWPSERGDAGRFSDRSVLQDDAVHYLHAGEVYSAGL
jgi:hypothetical protein